MFRSTSPALANTPDGTLKECPTGKILREAPWAFDALRAASCADSAGFDLHRQSAWLQSAVGVVASERERLRELRDQKRQSKSDAGYASRVLTRGRHG